MAFSFELGLVISTERYGAILAEPEHPRRVSALLCLFNVRERE